MLRVAAVQDHQGISINDPDNLSLQSISEAGGGDQKQEEDVNEVHFLTHINVQSGLRRFNRNTPFES